ncbi:MAG: hypothetical protein JWN86_2023 [Planctomycetota bacterium]|nr:hypothetical protein [Planctomycetota bacterium]
MASFPQTDPTASDAEAAPGPAQGDELVTISRWELEALRSRAAGAPTAAPAEFAEPIEPRATPSSVPSAREDDPRDRKAAELERAYKAAIRDRELATALAGRSLVPGAAAQLIKLWREDFDVYESDGELRVTARDGRDVSKAVGERLAEAEYAHFCPSTSRGGAMTKGTGRSASPPAPAAPRTLGEAALLRWREGASGRGDPASGSIGLRRR